MKEPTREELLQFHDGTLAHAKERLAEMGSIPGVAYIWGEKMEVGPWLRGTIKDLRTKEKMTDDMFGVNPNGGLILCIPCLYGDQVLLVHMLEYLCQDPEKGTETINRLLDVSIKFGVENPYATILKVFKERFGLDEKRIVVNVLKKVCEEVNAVAIVKVDEIWMVTAEKMKEQTVEEVRGQYPKDLSEHPGREEALQSFLETKTFRRSLLLPFSRKSQKEEDPTYKEVIWGEQKVMEDSVEKQIFAGRFTNLLMPPPSKKAEVPEELEL